MAAQKLNFREKIVIKILLMVSVLIANDDDVKKQIESLSAHISYAKDDA